MGQDCRHQKAQSAGFVLLGLEWPLYADPGSPCNCTSGWQYLRPVGARRQKSTGFAALGTSTCCHTCCQEPNAICKSVPQAPRFGTLPSPEACFSTIHKGSVLLTSSTCGRAPHSSINKWECQLTPEWRIAMTYYSACGAKRPDFQRCTQTCAPHNTHL
jgi:hypothetical protein